MDAARRLLWTLRACSSWQPARTPSATLDLYWDMAWSSAHAMVLAGTRLLRAWGGSSRFCPQDSQSHLLQSKQETVMQEHAWYFLRSADKCCP